MNLLFYKRIIKNDSTNANLAKAKKAVDPAEYCRQETAHSGYHKCCIRSKSGSPNSAASEDSLVFFKYGHIGRDAK